MNRINFFNTRGMTLLEVLAALVLAGIVLAVLQTSLAQSVFTQSSLSGRLAVISLGESKLAELEVGAEPASSGEFPAPYQKLSWRAFEETDNAGMIRITLTVEWRDPSGALRQKPFYGRRDPE
jgi:prepilin-type N-terminal cleavage/methylation domain-containing protein